MWFLCVGLCGIVGDWEVLNGKIDFFLFFLDFFDLFPSGVPSQNSRPHAGMVCMVIPPKRGLEYLEVQILEYLIPGL